MSRVGPPSRRHLALLAAAGIVALSCAATPGVAAPAAVRYGWAPNPKCDLVNAAGLPASPFRTNTRPVNDGPSNK